MTRPFLRMTTALALALALAAVLVERVDGTPQNALVLRTRHDILLVDVSRGVPVILQPAEPLYFYRWAGERLIFSLYNTSIDLYAQHPASPPRMLVTSEDHEIALDTTPGGEWVAYGIGKEDAVGVIGPAGQPQFMHQGVRSEVKLSPDGTRLAFGAQSRNGPVLHIRETHSGNMQTAFEVPGLIDSLAWSGAGLAYTTWEANRLRLGLLPTDATQPMYAEIDGSVPLFAWHPTRRELAVVVFGDAPPPALYALSLADPSPQLVTSLPGVPAGMAWSPDGETLAVTVYPSGASRYQLYALQHGQLRGIYRAQNPGATAMPVWSPDGAWVYLVDRTPRSSGFLVAVRIADGATRVPVPGEVLEVLGWWTPGG